MRVMTDMVCGVISAAPRPCTTRAEINAPMSPENPHQADAPVNNTSPIK